MRKFMVAAVQMDTQNDKQANWQQMCAFIDEAAAKGAKLVAFPEVVNILSEDPAYAEPIPGPTTELLMQKAREHHIWIHGGSTARSTRKVPAPTTRPCSLIRRDTSRPVTASCTILI